MIIVFVTPEFVSESNFDGGLSNYLYRVSLYLKDFGHSPIIVVASHSNEVINYQGIEVHRVNTLRPLWFKVLDKITNFQKFFYSITHVWLSFILNREVKRIINTKKIDIIQYPNIAGLAYFRPKNIPSVIRMSSYKKLWDEIEYGSVGQKPKSSLYKQFNHFQNLALKRVDKIFAPSLILAERLENDLHLKVDLIETPFHLREINEDKKILNDIILKTNNNDYLLYFGTLSLRKGIKFLADNLYEILKINPKMYFVFIGKTFGQFNGSPIAKYILESSKEYRNRIIIFDKLEHEKLYPVIKKAKAIVLPSLIDNLPNTCIESMALKKPVIAAFGSSLDQIIDNNLNGYLFNLGIRDDFINVINKVWLENQEQLDKIGDMAYKKILNLSPEITVHKLLTFYNKSINDFDNKIN